MTACVMTPTDWITLGQLLVLIVQLVVFAVQAWFLRGTLSATMQAADAAKQSANVAEKSVDSIERPYVLVDEVAPKIREYMGDKTPPQEPPNLTLFLKNYGRSPALILEVKGQLQMIQPGGDPLFIPSIPLGNVVVIGPSEKWQSTFHYSNLVGNGVQSQIENETFHFWFFVLVRYEDMLGKEHQTQMRFRYATRENKFLMRQGDDYTIRT